MIKKQITIIAICLAVCIALGVVYAIWLAPSPAKEPAGDQSSNTIFPMILKQNIKEIKIHNETGDYGFYQEKGEFYITGYEGTPYESSYFTMLVSAVRDTRYRSVVTDNPENLAQYGLDKLADPDYFEITDISGNSYKVYVGDRAPTGDGYYAMLETKPTVYMLDTSLEYTKRSIESYVTPIFSFPMNEKDYFYAEKFTLSVEGEPYISVGFMDEQKRSATASTTYYEMLVPANYVPSSSNYDHILQAFTEPNGIETVAFGNVAKDTMDKAILAEYGLDKPKYEIYYRYSGLDNYIYVSEQNEDGSYYAYSPMFNIISKVSAEKFDFLSWRFIDFIDKPMFQKNINDMKTITIEAPDFRESYTIAGADKELGVVPGISGIPFDATELESFKQLYIKLLSLSLEDYAETTEGGEWIMSFTALTRNGIEYKYDFYAYSTRRCYFTINGEGEFYVLRDRAEKIVEDAKLLMSGGVITNEVS